MCAHREWESGRTKSERMGKHERVKWLWVWFFETIFYFHLLYFTQHQQHFPGAAAKGEKEEEEVRRNDRKYTNKHTRTAVPTNKQICWIYVVCMGKCLCAPANPKRIWSVAFANDYLLENINSIFKWIPTMCLRIHITFYLLLCFIPSLRNYCRSKCSELWK